MCPAPQSCTCRLEKMGQCLILGLWKKGFGVHACCWRPETECKCRCEVCIHMVLYLQLEVAYYSLCQVGYIAMKYFAEYCIYVNDFLYFQKFIVHLLIYVIFCSFFSSMPEIYWGGGYCLVLVDLLFLFILCQLCTFVFGCHFYLFQLSMLMTQAHLMLQLLRVSWMHLLFSPYAEKPTSWNEMWAAAWEDEKKKSQKPFYCNGMDLSGPWSTICSSCTFWQKSEGFLTKR